MGCSAGLLLLDAPPRWSSVLDDWCAPRGVPLYVASASTAHQVDFANVAGCLAFVGACDVRSTLELRRRLPDVGWLAVGDRLASGHVAALARGGVRLLARSGSTEEDLASRALVLLAEHRAPCGASAWARRAWTSPAMRRLVPRIEALARSRSHVLIVGASGSGRSFVARCIAEGDGGGTPQLVADAREMRETPPARALLVEDVQDLDAESRCALVELVRGHRRRVFATADETRARVPAELSMEFQILEVPPVRERRLDLPLIARAELDRVSELLSVDAPSMDAAWLESFETTVLERGFGAVQRLVERAALRGGSGLSLTSTHRVSSHDPERCGE